MCKPAPGLIGGGRAVVVYRKFWTGLAFAALAAAAPAAQTVDRKQLADAVGLAIDRGELLYIYDRAAWVGTDDFVGQHSDLMGQTGGYIVTGDQSQIELAFYDKSKTKALYRATFAEERMVKSGKPASDRVDLSPLEKRMIAAKEKGTEAIIHAKVGMCAEASPNLAALPPTNPDGPILVYLMTPQTDLKSYPLGGHYSVEVRSDGTTGKVRHFTNSCINMPMDQLPSGTKPAAFVITHLLDATPTEIHVFTSLASKVPLIVVTNPDAQMWSVDGNRIAQQGSVNRK
jgi:hypothetical protein